MIYSNYMGIKEQKKCRKELEKRLMNMDLSDFLDYSGLQNTRGSTAMSYARGLIGHLYDKDGKYYHLGKRKVKDLYSLSLDYISNKMPMYGIKTAKALNKVLVKNNLPKLPR